MILRTAYIPRLFPLLLFHLLIPLNHAGLDSLRTYQRECFPDVSACFMFMDDQRAFGCAQCDVDIRTESVRLFEQGAQLLSFIDPENERRVVMMPEHVFFSQSVLNGLAEAVNVAAVVVFEEDNANATYPPISFFNLSTDLVEPNERYNRYPEGRGPDDYERNRDGRGTKFEMYPFNIFRVNKDQGAKIMALMRRFPDMNPNTGTDSFSSGRSPTSPRYKLQSVGRMYACPALEEDEDNPPSEPLGETISRLANSRTCLKDRTCLPIGGQSIWSALEHLTDYGPDETDELRTRRILAISAPMDSNAFFTDFALGASAEISAMAVMMAVAEAISIAWGPHSANTTMGVQPVYFGWNAQSWGYAGSGRFLKDLRDFDCPEENKRRKYDRVNGCDDKYMNSLKFQQLKDARITVLNLGQLTFPQEGNAPRQTPSSFFWQGSRSEQPIADELSFNIERAFTGSEEIGGMLMGGLEDVIPLDASQSFNKFLSGADVLTITGYNTSFENPLYHSMFDNVTLVDNFDQVASFANAIVSAVVALMLDSEANRIDLVNGDRIKEIMQCLSMRWADEPCTLATDFLSQETVSESDDRVMPGNYPGSFFPDTRLEEVNESGFLKLSLIRNFLAHHNRYAEKEIACTTDADCEDFEMELNTDTSDIHVRRVYCSRGACVASDTYTHNAFGPGLSSTNREQTAFELSDTEPPSDTSSPSVSSQSSPVEAAWTESVWDFDFGLCGFVEDTPLFGGLILGSGLLVVIISFVVVIRFDKYMFKPKPEEEFAAIIGDPGAPPESDGNNRWVRGEPSV